MRFPLLSGLFLAFAALWGCASTTDQRLEAIENQMVGQQILDLRVAQVEDRLTAVEQDLGTLKEAAPAVKKTSALPGPRKIDPNAPPTPLPGRSSGPVQAGSAQAGSGQTGPARTVPAPAAKDSEFVPVAPAARASSGEKSAYDAALAIYDKGKYQEAAGLFTAFLETYPESPLRPNARYWLGECHYSQKQYDQAILAFKDVAGKYPKHPKAAASLLKLGYSYANMGDVENARFYLQMLLDDFPGSPPASLGQKRLQSLT